VDADFVRWRQLVRGVSAPPPQVEATRNP
jgi:hypothetical protein